jgi:hypothetical protein
MSGLSSRCDPQTTAAYNSRANHLDVNKEEGKPLDTTYFHRMFFEKEARLDKRVD